jgi:hypothetical protein
MGIDIAGFHLLVRLAPARQSSAWNFELRTRQQRLPKAKAACSLSGMMPTEAVGCDPNHWVTTANALLLSWSESRIKI